MLRSSGFFVAPEKFQKLVTAELETKLSLYKHYAIVFLYADGTLLLFRNNIILLQNVQLLYKRIAVCDYRSGSESHANTRARRLPLRLSAHSEQASTHQAHQPANSRIARVTTDLVRRQNVIIPSYYLLSFR